METSFGRGTIYDLTENIMIAEVYYFIQDALPSSAAREFHGFLDPILEYENLAESFKKSSQALLLIDKGRRLLINTVSPQVNQTLPIFFSGKIETEQAETHKEVMPSLPVRAEGQRSIGKASFAGTFPYSETKE